MSTREISSTGDLIGRLAEGWRPPHTGLAEDLVRCLGVKLHAEVEVQKVGENSLVFTADLSDIRLRGMDRVPCLLLGGTPSGGVPLAQEFINNSLGPKRVPFVLTVSDPAYQQARTVFPPETCLVLSAAQVHLLLHADNPRKFLKECLWQQVPRRRLIPYNITLPAEGAMFFGRAHELSRLQEEEDTCFAIAGPGRVGKTSLVRRYYSRMTGKGAIGVNRRFYINFYDCGDTTPDGVARFFAMRVDSSSRSHRMTAGELVNFLKYHCSTLGGPPDLVLDEVDQVCQGEAFKALDIAARDGYCRLVLCGRGVLLKTALSLPSPLACRLELMRLEPLDPEIAKKLLIEPLVDLGFSITEKDRFTDLVFRLTGRLPHLLQFYGKGLVELALDEKTDDISLAHIDRLRWDFETAQYFTSPLQDLQDSRARLLALSLLKENRPECTISSVQEIAAQQGLCLGHQQAIDVCNDLVINNVLAWSNGSFRIANEAMPDYARKLGYLDSALEEARLVAKQA